MAHEGEAAQVVGDEPLAHPVDMAFVGVVGHCSGFVAATKADEVWCNHPMTGSFKNGHHRAIEVRPTWFAVHAQHGGSGVARASVVVRNSQGVLVLCYIGVSRAI